MDRSLYTRPSKPRSMAVTRRTGAPAVARPALPEITEVDCFTECHVTPLNIAARMVEYLDATPGLLTLKPSAGTGNLIQALSDSGHSNHALTVIERHYGLCQTIQNRFKNNKGESWVKPISQCFLEYADEAQGKIVFPRIIMNPPFKQIRKHMKAALSLLGAGGHGDATLVALVPITYEHDDAETLEVLGRGTFPTAKVSTKIIRIEV